MHKRACASEHVQVSLSAAAATSGRAGGTGTVEKEPWASLAWFWATLCASYGHLHPPSEHHMGICIHNVHHMGICIHTRLRFLLTAHGDVARAVVVAVARAYAYTPCCCSCTFYEEQAPSALCSPHSRKMTLCCVSFNSLPLWRLAPRVLAVETAAQGSGGRHQLDALWDSTEACC